MEESSTSVAIVLPSLAIGGAERIALNVARALTERGFDVEIVVVDAKGGLSDQVPDAVNIVESDTSRVLTSTPKLANYLRQSKPDVMLSTTQPANIVSIWTTLIPGVDTKHIVRVARPESIASEVEENTRKDRITTLLARRFYPFADEIVAISKGVADDLVSNTKVTHDDVNVIYNPVVTEEVREKSRESVDHPYFTDGSEVVLAVGRLVDQKGFSTLIQAFDRLQRTRDVKLVIYGDGSNRDELEQLISKLDLENDIDLPGFTDNPYKYMAQADVFVNSAKHEGFGNVIVEAMACGTQIVATNCPGAPNEILGNGEFGALVPVGDAEKMADKIDEALASQPESNKIIDRSEDFSIEKNVVEYITLTKRLVDC